MINTHRCPRNQGELYFTMKFDFKAMALIRAPLRLEFSIIPPWARPQEPLDVFLPGCGSGSGLCLNTWTHTGTHT